MERYAAENIKADREAHARAALKAKVPWMDVMRDFGLTMEEVMRLSEEQAGLPPSARRDDIRDAREDPQLTQQRRGRR